MLGEPSRAALRIWTPWQLLTSTSNRSFDPQPHLPPCKGMTFELDGSEYSLAKLPRLHSKWWFVLDSAILHFKANSINKGYHYKVELEMGLVIPYISAGPNNEPLVASGRLIKSLVCN